MVKILIVKTSSLGDILQVFPVIDYLKRKFPTGQIDWVVEQPFAELLRSHPQINRVLTINSKVWRKNPLGIKIREQIKNFRKQLRLTHYDLLFDLQGNLKSSAVVFLAFAKEKVGFGWKTVHEWPAAFFTNVRINPPNGKNIREDYLGVVRGYFNDDKKDICLSNLLTLDPFDEQRLISLFLNISYQPTLVCPFSAWPNKCLSDDALIQFLKKINYGPYWLIWAVTHERERAIKISSNLEGSVVLERLSLPLLQHVMAKCKLVIAMDSLPLHLCATTSTASLSFFGPSSSAKFAPLGLQHLAIQGECPYGERFEKTCSKLRTCKTGLCMKVADHVDRWAETAKRAGF